MQSTGKMEIAELVVETISCQHRNRFPLPNALGAPAFRGQDVTTFLHKYESLAAFTATDVTESSVIAMLPYYCTEEIRETVMMMRGYTDRDWAALKKEMLDVFRYSDSRPDSLVYTRQYLEQLSATFSDQTESLKSFLRTYDHISGVVTERGMMCEYERTEMLLHALPKLLWRKAISKLGINPLEPHTFNYCRLNGWLDARCSAAEALAMFEFLASPTSTVTAPSELTTSPAPMALAPMASKSSAATEMTPSTSPALTTSASTTPSASLTLVFMTAPTVSMTAPTASVTPMAPTISTAHRSPAATDMTSTPSGSASPMTSTVSTAPTVQLTAPMTSENLTTLTSPTTPAAPSTILTTPTAPISPTAFTPPARTHTARQGTIRAGPTPEPIRPHRTESTVTCRSEPAPPNRQELVKLPQSEPIVPSHNQPVPPYRQDAVQPPPYSQDAVQPPPCQEPVQPPQQVDRPPCYYCADDQHNLQKCVELRLDLKRGIVSINNRDRLILGTAGAEIPMAPAARDF
ncbi:hypothetical protein K440DRAFT_643860, partial [Wilcoxina mikolae CBS 423.85]